MSYYVYDIYFLKQYGLNHWVLYYSFDNGEAGRESNCH